MLLLCWFQGLARLAGALQHRPCGFRCVELQGFGVGPQRLGQGLWRGVVLHVLEPMQWFMWEFPKIGDPNLGP